MHKKLKKIPYDLISYIQIETEAIKDANDKMMISSYCMKYLKDVEWYMELLRVGSEKYIVPHSMSELENIKEQLMVCYKNIMNVKLEKQSNYPPFGIKYPKGYEG